MGGNVFGGARSVGRRTMLPRSMLSEGDRGEACVCGKDGGRARREERMEIEKNREDPADHAELRRAHLESSLAS